MQKFIKVECTNAEGLYLQLVNLPIENLLPKPNHKKGKIVKQKGKESEHKSKRNSESESERERER
jgi:hypothetical protein